ncbi:hypothetical protein K1719_039302 [Acacia pycnantha]|nr:hypothetical protein K1719_039302 [Acacia pycnantha]
MHCGWADGEGEVDGGFLNLFDIRISRVDHAEDHKCQASQDPSVRPQVLIVASSASKEKTQLRNLVWATSKHDVYLISNYSVMHWSSLTGNLSEIINFSGHVAPTEE